MRDTVFIYTPIGIIHSGFKIREGAPIQPAFANDAPGRVIVYEEYAAGLKDLEGFSHIILVYHFHLSEGWRPLVRPFMEEIERGVFATRAPRRPNQIGLSVVRLERIENAALHVRGIDLVDGAPLLDIKPYAPAFDAAGEYRSGWIADALNKEARRVADDRFTDSREGKDAQ
ncbi:MAG: tRNA (N6-threonylcarbamoyladenosine(37)-N6)-methyltransferase TrmO [Candidatus Latescibacterota bacterium]